MDADKPDKIGRYDVVALVGKGAMGKVFKAVEPKTNRLVAIKVLSSEFVESEPSVERFHREAEAISKLNHRNVVRIVEKVQEDDQLYFVMEFVNGVSLESILKQRRLSLPEAVTVFKGVCQGLEAAHREGIVHRDLSPRNVLVSDDLSTIKIADFGISRVESISREMGTLSTSEVSMGSLHYMAPEQAVKMVEADHRSDIYSAGVLLYEMLTGRVPVGRFSLPSQLNSEVPPDIDPVVLRCLEAAPGDRYPSVTQLLAELRRLEDRLRLGLVSELKGISQSTTKIILKSSRSRFIQWSLVALALAVIAFAAFYLIQRRGATTKAAAPPSHQGAVVIEDEAVPADAEATGEPEPALSDPPLESEDLEVVEETLVPDSEPPPEPQPVETPVQRESPPPRVEATVRKPAEPPLAERLAEEIEIARAKVEAQLYQPARDDLESLIEANPQHPAVARAYLLLGQTYALEGRSDEAKAAYVELRSRFEATDEAVEGLYRMAKLSEPNGRQGRQEARVLLTQLLDETGADSSWRVVALAGRAHLEETDRVEVQDRKLGAKVPAALVSYRHLVIEQPSHAEAEDAWWELGEMYSDLKRFDLAAAAFEELGTRFPSTRHDAWWRAGQTHDRRLDNTQKAIEAYAKVPSTSRHYQDAQKRLAKLGG